MFQASQSVKNLIQEVKDFLHEEVVPLERQNGVGYKSETPLELLRQVWKRSAETGFYKIMLPKEYGGAGLSTLETSFLKEEILATDCVLAHHVIGEFSGPPRVGHLFKTATPYQLENFLLPVASGDKAVCFALTEAGAGSDAAAIATTAVSDGDSYRLNGSKRFITGGSYADFGIVMAVTDPDKGAKGISSFLVDFSLPGVKRNTDYEPITGKGGHADFVFEDCVIPKECILGAEGDGFKLAMSRVTQNRLLHCSVICGLARRSFESALRHSTARTQFGRRLADFQAIQHKLAKMHSQIFAIWSMTLHAAHLTDQGEDVRRHAAMCKYFVAETGFAIADEAVQVHGGIGIMKGHLAEWVFSMLRMYRIGTGTSEIQLNTIAKELLKGPLA